MSSAVCRAHLLRRALPIALVLSLTPAAAGAQYFGQNKVRYAELDFKVLETEHFDIYYYDGEQRAIEHTARMAERWYARLSTLLGHQLSRRQPLILYASHAEFRQTTVIPGMIGQGTGGVTEGLRNRIVMPFTASLAETSHVLGHELVHAFQFDMSRRMSRGGASRLPLWFVEGMAEYLSLGPVHTQTALWLRDAAAHDELPDFGELDDPRYFPYRFGHAAWAYIAGRWGDDAVRTVFLAAGSMGDPLSAIRQLTGQDEEALSRSWHDAIRSTYGPLAKTDGSPRGRALITEDGDGGELNVGPALSPDGERMVFFPERDVFSIEMFLADARTGDVVRKLTEVATDPHFDSLQFLDTTGAWSSDSRRFVYATVQEATPAFVIIDAASGDTIREIEVPSVDGAMNPTWSPDGRYLAFSGMLGGISDLFIYDLEEDRLDQATRDLYAQIQPDWSPDGRSIALMTDCFGTDLDTLSFGSYRVAFTTWRRAACGRCPGSGARRTSTRSGRPTGSRCISWERRTGSRTCSGCRSRAATSRRSPASSRA
jgi:hypothetical protein